MTVAYIHWTKMYYFIFQNKQKIVKNLLKWLLWTSINLDIVKKSICINTVCLLPPRVV